MDLSVKAVHPLHEGPVTLCRKNSGKIRPFISTFTLWFQCFRATSLYSVRFRRMLSGDFLPEISVPLYRQFPIA